MFRNISKCLYEMCLKFEIMKCRKFSATMNSREKAAKRSILNLLGYWFPRLRMKKGIGIIEINGRESGSLSGIY